MRVFNLNLNERENTSNNHAKRTSSLCFILISLITFANQIDSLLNSSDNNHHHHRRRRLLNENEYVAKHDDALSLLAPTFSNECKSDLHCVDGKFCLNGSCVDTCYNGDMSEQCIYFHCNSKQLITNESSSSSANAIIETNNYPQLSSYFSNQKCSWLLKSQTNNKNNKTSLPFIQLSFSRFSTLHTSDYLYIFDGDSIYSPMIASLR